VLAIRYGIERRNGFGRILVPVHLNQHSTDAAALAAAIAKREKSEVHLIIVCADGTRGPADALIAEMTSDLFAGVNVKPIVLQGKDIDSELVRYARGADADAIFLNAAAHEISTRKQDIIRQVDTPVMLVPPAAAPMS